MFKVNDIIEGWRNKLIPSSHLKDLIEEVHQERMNICRECPFFSENRKKHGYKTIRADEHCTDCGCTLAPKARCLSCECPKKFWFPVTTQEEHEKIKSELK